MALENVLEILVRRPVLRTMVIVAHPDDEIIGAGIHLELWPNLTIVHATDGAPRNSDFARLAGFVNADAYAAARFEEVADALSVVNISRGQVIDSDSRTS